MGHHYGSSGELDKRKKGGLVNGPVNFLLGEAGKRCSELWNLGSKGSELVHLAGELLY